MCYNSYVHTLGGKDGNVQRERIVSRERNFKTRMSLLTEAKPKLTINSSFEITLKADKFARVNIYLRQTQGVYTIFHFTHKKLTFNFTTKQLIFTKMYET